MTFYRQLKMIGNTLRIGLAKCGRARVIIVGEVNDYYSASGLEDT